MKFTGILALFFIFQLFPYFFMPKFIEWLRDKAEVPQDIRKEINTILAPSQYLTKFAGVLERLFFTIVVIFYGAGVAAAMITWMVVKMATNWHLIAKSTSEIDRKSLAYRRFAFCSLYAGMVSLLFALLGGLLINKIIELDF
jgi:hypothetical protein